VAGWQGGKARWRRFGRGRGASSGREASGDVVSLTGGGEEGSRAPPNA
jgi:hypothetical protein